MAYKDINKERPPVLVPIFIHVAKNPQNIGGGVGVLGVNGRFYWTENGVIVDMVDQIVTEWDYLDEEAAYMMSPRNPIQKMTIRETEFHRDCNFCFNHNYDTGMNDSVGKRVDTIYDIKMGTFEIHMCPQCLATLYNYLHTFIPGEIL